MFKVIKYVFVIGFVLGGWALAALSLHLVRTPIPADKPAWLPVWVELVPKSNLTFRQVWVDTTKWTANDLAANPEIVGRLYDATRKVVVEGAAARGIALPVSDPATPKAIEVTQPVSTTAADAPKAEKTKSIFDFRK